MTKQKKSFWLKCTTAAAVLGLALFFILSHDAGPYYQGKPLDTYWFPQLSMMKVMPTPGYMWANRDDVLVLHGNRYGHFKESPIVVSNAIVAMGTNSLPFLLHKLQRHNIGFCKNVEKWMGKVRIDWTPWRDADTERAQAVTALLVLGQNRLVTPEAVERMRELSKGSDADVAAAAKWALQYYPGP